MSFEQSPLMDGKGESGKEKPSTKLFLDGARFLETSERWFQKLSFSDKKGADVAKSNGPPAPRHLRLILTVQTATIILLAVGMLTLHIQVSRLLGAATTVPVAITQSVSEEVVVSKLCKDSSLDKDLHKHLHDVVLIINTNYEGAARSTSAFLRELYGRFFDKIVMISPKSIPELGIEARGQHVWTEKWYWAYWHLPRVISDYPDAAGYLWTNDDVAINYWHLLKTDKTKLWLTNDLNHPESKYFPFHLGEQAKFSDWAAENKTRVAASQAYSAMEERYRKQMDESNGHLAGTFPKRITDLLYIPRRYAKAFAFDLLPIYREFKLWSEVAIPMMFYSLANPRDWDPVFNDMIFRWDHWDQEKVFNPMQFWKPEVSAFHPWKLSQESSRKALIMAFSKEDPCILQLTPK